MIGYKGFDKDFKCRDMQYEVGKTYIEKEAKLCKKGLHFCENPLDVFTYYSPNDGKFAEIEADDVSPETGDDSKRVAKKLTVKTEINLFKLVKLGVEYIKTQIDWDNNKESNTGDYSAATNTGDRSAATNTGDYSAATNTGDRSAATNTGYRSAATNTGYRSAATNTGDYSAATVDGKESVAISLGASGYAKGAIGCWIVLAEWDTKSGHRVDVKSFYVDGEKVKANTFYILRNGELVEYSGEM